jgi:hypothetical protein
VLESNSNLLASRREIGWILAGMCVCVIAQSTRSGIENNLFSFHSVRTPIWFHFSDCRSLYFVSTFDVHIFDDGASVPLLCRVTSFFIIYVSSSLPIIFVFVNTES